VYNARALFVAQRRDDKRRVKGNGYFYYNHRARINIYIYICGERERRLLYEIKILRLRAYHRFITSKNKKKKLSKRPH